LSVMVTGMVRPTCSTCRPAHQVKYFDSRMQTCESLSASKGTVTTGS
jgi:hypothetical protein